MMPGETLVCDAQGHSSRYNGSEYAGVAGVCFAGVIGVLRRRFWREYAGVLRLERSAGAHDRAHQNPTCNRSSQILPGIGEGLPIVNQRGYY